jgi:hypothetical protein
MAPWVDPLGLMRLLIVCGRCRAPLGMGRYRSDLRVAFSCAAASNRSRLSRMVV